MSQTFRHWWGQLSGAALVLALGACGSDVMPPSDVASMFIEGLDVVTITPGEPTTLLINARDARGAQITEGLVPEWSADASGRVTVNARGEIQAAGPLGLGWVFANLAGFRDSVAVWVQKPQSEPSTFEITLVFSDRVPALWRTALETAARRWIEVIRAPLPAVDVASLPQVCGWVDPPPPSVLAGVESGVRIWVGVSDRFPVGTYVEAVGGPCVHRGLPQPTTVLGVITINPDRYEEGIDDDRLRYAAHHEMGHTLGLAGIVQGFQPSWIRPPTNESPGAEYSGLLGLFGFRMDSGQIAQSIPISAGSHWELWDIMGRGPNPLPISNVSVGSLMDFGYPAAWYGAGALVR